MILQKLEILFKDLLPLEEKVFIYILGNLEFHDSKTPILNYKDISTNTGISISSISRIIPILENEKRLIKSSSFHKKGKEFYLNLYSPYLQCLVEGGSMDDGNSITLQARALEYKNGAREVAKYLQFEYAKKLLEYNNEAIAKVVGGNFYYKTSFSTANRLLKCPTNETVKEGVERWKKEINQRLTEEYWFKDKIMTMKNVENNEGKKYDYNRR